MKEVIYLGITIKELPIHDRPRERMIQQGVDHLSDSELLAIILASGTLNQSATELASYVLKELKSLEALETVTYQQLIQLKGIGPAKACTILAIEELSKRIQKQKYPLEHVSITKASQVFEYYQNQFYHEKKEYFYCIYLDQRKKIIKDQCMFIGTLNESLVHPREIFKEAYLLSASALIVMHNHPSNHVTPSNADRETTTLLKNVGEILGIPLLDHIIIGPTAYYSFAENSRI